MKKMLTAVLSFSLAVFFGGALFGGDIDSPGLPSSGSGMYTFSEVYYYLTEGTEGSIAGSFQEPLAGPASMMMNTKVIYDDIKAEFDQCDAAAADVADGKVFFSTQTTAWGAQTGTASAGLSKTGQFTSYTDYDDAYYADPAGDDIGNPQGLGTWSAYTADGGRFTLQIEGGETVVVDNVTGLMWEQKDNGGGAHDKDNTYTWQSAFVWIRGVNSASFAGQTDWRLPNYHELTSIVDCSKSAPTIDTNFFRNTQSNYYWSSTTRTGNTGYAWVVHFEFGSMAENSKPNEDYKYVRAVRGGE